MKTKDRVKNWWNRQPVTIQYFLIAITVILPMVWAFN